MMKSVLVKWLIKDENNKNLGGSRMNLELYLRKVWERLII